MFLFIDTETTGFSKNGALVQDGQARVCQIAMLMTDENGKSLSEISFLIKPDGWKIGEDASRIHGFTNELCDQYGVSGAAAYSLYSRLAGMCSLVVAHNVNFDRKMMEIEAAYNKSAPISNQWLCTMLKTKDICKLSGQYNDYKWPKLDESLKHMCGRELGDLAHDALWDVRACKDIFFALIERGIINKPERKNHDTTAAA